jgi:hypothetical protein
MREMPSTHEAVGEKFVLVGELTDVDDGDGRFLCIDGRPLIPQVVRDQKMKAWHSSDEESVIVYGNVRITVEWL